MTRPNRSSNPESRQHKLPPFYQCARDNLLIYGLGGIVVPFIGIKLIDMLLVALRLV